MHVIYRKYRPRTFGEVIGQEHITETLSREIAQESVAHAYLFVGPRGTGKTTVARVFSRSLNCSKRTANQFEPCNSCDACKQILAERYLDVVEIDAATHTQVDHVRETIIASLRIPPLIPNGYKFFIIDEVHMLSKHAFNALLKAIEEPPHNVVFILATTEVTKVPDTIISRCERFDFKLIPNRLMIERLTGIAKKENVQISGNVMIGIAKRAQGSLRDAESLLGQIIAIADDGVIDDERADLIIPRQTWNHAGQVLELLSQKDISGALNFINQIINEGIDIENVILELIEYARLVLLKKSLGKSYAPDLDDDTITSVNLLSEKYSLTDLQRLLSLLTDAQLHPNYNIPQLPLELVCVGFCEDVIKKDPNVKVAAEQTTKSSVSMRSDTTTDLSTIRKEWDAILRTLRDYNHSLAVFLKVAHPLTLEKDMLIIGFKYNFHANTVRENRNKTLTEEIISQILGKSILIDCIVDSNYVENHKIFNGSGEPEVQDVLDAMGGGEIV